MAMCDRRLLLRERYRKLQQNMRHVKFVVARETTGEGARDGSDHVAWRAELKAPAPVGRTRRGWDFYASASVISSVLRRIAFSFSAPSSDLVCDPQNR